ncbi:hypothetical protein RF11_08349 [Thelohanellus kitauei]|uniref:Uncharacterized protein n=1 Tax=Thelohanellus kitauei TaxID=669202 RepID=A0A0C2J5E3_THEKT|nr:hypothetical protein RF11_08349 [Thelohanellus kitauei]
MNEQDEIIDYQATNLPKIFTQQREVGSKSFQKAVIRAKLTDKQKESLCDILEEDCSGEGVNETNNSKFIYVRNEVDTFIYVTTCLLLIGLDILTDRTAAKQLA